MMEKEVMDLAGRFDACDEAMAWLSKQQTAQQAWTDCDRGDWMLWLCARLGIDRKLVVLAACDCAESVAPFWPVGDDRPRKAIETARKWCGGECELSEVRAAANAAYAAAYAAARAAYAAARAAYAAANAAANAAYAAAYAANAAANAAYRQSLAESANIVRKHISWEMIEEKIGVEHAKEVRERKIIRK